MPLGAGGVVGWLIEELYGCVYEGSTVARRWIVSEQTQGITVLSLGEQKNLYYNSVGP